MKIGFQGAVGAYSETAAQRAWPGSETVALDRFEDVFEAVASGRTSHGILPVENSIGGSIHRNYDLLLEHDLPIVAETELPVVHNLLALPGIDCRRPAGILAPAGARAVRDVPAHAPGHRDRRHLRHGGQRPDDHGWQPDRHGSDRVAARGGVLRAERRCRRGFRTTRTTSRASSSSAATASRSATPDKTTLAFALHNGPGALFKALSVFALRDIDMTKLESRPARGPAVGIRVLRRPVGRPG